MPVISYPLSLPTVTGFRATELLPETVVGVNRSPFTGQRQVYAWPGQWLKFAVSLPAMTEASAGDWMGWFMALNGPEGTFLLGPTVRKTPRGTATGTPLVKGASQVGNELITDGWTAGVTNILRRGDWFQLGSGSTSRLHRVTADANSNGSGEATLGIWPRLRSSPGDNDALTISSPKGLFCLEGMPSEAYDPMKICDGMTFVAVEALS